MTPEKDSRRHPTDGSTITSSTTTSTPTAASEEERDDTPSFAEGEEDNVAITSSKLTTIIQKCYWPLATFLAAFSSFPPRTVSFENATIKKHCHEKRETSVVATNSPPTGSKYTLRDATMVILALCCVVLALVVCFAFRYLYALENEIQDFKVARMEDHEYVRQLESRIDQFHMSQRQEVEKLENRIDQLETNALTTIEAENQMSQRQGLLAWFRHSYSCLVSSSSSSADDDDSSAEENALTIIEWKEDNFLRTIGSKIERFFHLCKLVARWTSILLAICGILYIFRVMRVGGVHHHTHVHYHILLTPLRLFVDILELKEIECS